MDKHVNGDVLSLTPCFVMWNWSMTFQSYTLEIGHDDLNFVWFCLPLCLCRYLNGYVFS